MLFFKYHLPKFRLCITILEPQAMGKLQFLTQFLADRVFKGYGRRGVRESLEDQTMNMAVNVAAFLTENLRHANGLPVECVPFRVVRPPRPKRYK